MPSSGERLLERYRLVERLDRGGRSQAWLVEDEHRSVRVVAKLAPRYQADHLAREHFVLDRLDHPSIVRALGPLGTRPQVPFKPTNPV